MVAQFWSSVGPLLARRQKGKRLRRDVSFGLSFLFPHRAGDNTARTKILGWTPRLNCQQLDRLRNWIANITAWLYSSQPVLCLRIRDQHSGVDQEANR